VYTHKNSPGQCGCGVPDNDTDTDGVADCIDGCKNDFRKQSPGLCGCGNSDELQDYNRDGVPECSTGVTPVIALNAGTAGIRTTYFVYSVIFAVGWVMIGGMIPQ
jgi:hypothetical protein